MPKEKNWSQIIQPLLEKYKDRRHPLDYANVYQLVVMLILSAGDSERHINLVAPNLFDAFPDMKSLSNATPELLYPYISKVRNFATKAKYIVDIAKKKRIDHNIPLFLSQLIELPGIDRRSANIILRETGSKAEGAIVDIHVMRVATRLGIVTEPNAKKIEKELMKVLTPDFWDAGMALSFLGREICRPQPKCEACPLKEVCAYYDVKRHPVKTQIRY